MIVTANGLPVNAGILIGYALHERQSIRLSYLHEGKAFTRTQGDGKIMRFEETTEEHASAGKSLSMYVYVQAKSKDDGSASFYDYIKRKKL